MKDLIERQAAIRWVKTECNPYGKPTLDFESGIRVIEHLEQMPSAQPDVPDIYAGDMVYRQAAVDAIDVLHDKPNAWLDSAVDAVMALPSAQPEVLKCKDCYWWTKQSDSLQGRCDRYGFYPTGYWYCAAARERRTDDQT